MVRIRLPGNNKTIIPSKYDLYLPSEKQLVEELKKEIKNIEEETDTE